MSIMIRDRQQKVHFEDLDTIRFLAFGMVFLWHIVNYLPRAHYTFIERVLLVRIAVIGHLGVNLFFVLSGFLITYLLQKEKEKLGTIRVGFFYIRRILRIWPLYLIVILTGFFVIPLFTGSYDASVTKSHLPYFLSFLNNIDRIKTGFTGIGNDNLGVLWSIAVEEQFYLFWPWVIVALNRKQLPFLFTGIILFSLGFRYLHVQESNVVYLHTFSVMSDLAIGAALSWIAIYKNSLFDTLEKMPRYAIGLIEIAGLALVYFFKEWSDLNVFTLVVERVVLALFFAFVIGEQCFSKNSVFKLGRLSLFSNIGLITYGLYCLHLYTIALMQKINVMYGIDVNQPLVFYGEAFVCIGLSVLICLLSFRFFETPLLNYKDKFATIPT